MTTSNLSLEEMTKDLRVSYPLTKQGENWILMTVLQMPWHNANAIESQDDRNFLLEKAVEIHGHIRRQEEMMRLQMAQQKQQSGQGSIVSPSSLFS